MIFFDGGDIFESGCDALVNPVNCVGVAGKGLALAFKERFPLAYEAYKADCASGRLRIGTCTVHETDAASPRYIVNFPTKAHWRDRSRLQDINEGLDSLVNIVKDRQIQSLAVPALGCGLGGLGWKEAVRPLLINVFLVFPESEGRRIALYEPYE